MRFIVLVLLLVSFSGFGASHVLNEVTATTTSTLAVSADPYRCYLVIQNKGAVDVLVKPGSAHSASEGILINAGGSWEPAKAPTNDLYIKSSSSTSSLAIVTGGC